MKHQIHRIFGSATAMALVFFVAACGGKETVASKSAEALLEAQKNGTPVGNAATTSSADAGTSSADHLTMTGMDRSTLTGMDHSISGGAAPTGIAGMDHSKMKMSGPSTRAGMDHSNMPGMQRGARSGSSMAGMDHSRMASTGAQTSTMDHSTMTAMDHSNMPGMSPGNKPRDPQPPMAGMDHANMPGMQHGGPGDAKTVTAAQRSNTEIQRMQPASTLRPDAFDSPVAISVAEAAKTTQGGTNAPAYTCPMHPEVTSDKPGTCPKCGMTLMKKERMTRTNR